MVSSVRPLGKWLDQRVRAIRSGQLFWTLIVIDALILVALAGFALTPSQARLSINAKTQVAEVRVTKGHGFNAWGTITPTSVDPAALYENCDHPVLVMPAQLAGPVTFSAKSNPNGGFSITFKDFEPNTLGHLSCHGVPRSIEAYLVLTWDADSAKRLALQFAGTLTVGGYSSDMSEPLILEDGTISAESAGASFDSSRVSSDTKLFPGDYVLLAGNPDDDETVSHGLLRLVDGKIDVTAHTVARNALVTHIGQRETGPQSIAPSFFAKLQARSQWALLLLVVGVIVHMLGSLRDYLFERAIEEEGRAEAGDEP